MKLFLFILTFVLSGCVPTSQTTRDYSNTQQSSSTSESRQFTRLVAKTEISQNRYALVVGNNAYKESAKLQNPINDAKDIKKTLTDLGFDVLAGYNLNRRDNLKLLRQFTKKLKQDPNATALFYFAGHGIEINGENYLLPIQQAFSSEDDVKDEGLQVSTILNRMKASKSRVNIVILDACRNNPWARNWNGRGVGGGGLSKMSAPSGFLIAYAAAPGNVALDGKGKKNGLYTQYLLKHLKTPNITLEQVFKRTREDVEKASQGKQSPRETQALIGEDVYLAGKQEIKQGYSKAEVEALLRASKGDKNALKNQQLAQTFSGFMDAPLIIAKEQQFEQPFFISLGALLTAKEQQQINQDLQSKDIDVQQLATFRRVLYSQLSNKDRKRKLQQLFDQNHNIYAGLYFEQIYNTTKKPILYKQWKERNIKNKVVSRLTKLALKNNTFAQYVLGDLYNGFSGLMRNDAEAIKWYRKAAEQGNAYGQISLGERYRNGKGVQQNNVEAAKWYRKAAEQGNAVGQFILGTFYDKGKGVQQNDVEAVKWFRKAAEQGNMQGQKVLGLMYQIGKGVQQSNVEAVKWYRKAAEQGHATAQSSLGNMLRLGKGIQQSDTEAVKWYRNAAIQGNMNGQKWLGWMYQYGRGIQQSDVEAVKWFRNAAEQGETDSQFILGALYVAGKGIQKNDTEAVKWFRKAALQGDASAQFSLGWMYQKGKGVRQSDTEAIKWYRKAAKQGNKNAQAQLDKMK